MRSAIVMAFLASAAGGCASKKHRAFEEVASQINPQLLVVMPKLAIYIALARHESPDSARLYEQCRRADAELTAIAAVELPQALEMEDRGSSLPEDARELLQHRDSVCWHAAQQRVRTTCRWFCSDRWSEIVRVTNRLADAAAKEGIVIVRLPAIPAEARGISAP